MNDTPQRPAPPPTRSLFAPLALFMAAWLLWTGFQTVQLLRERGNLQTLHANQEPTVQTAQQMRQQLDALAAGTKRLADAGHPHAGAVVQELARRGVQISP
jgi:hypothetical protein